MIRNIKKYTKRNPTKWANRTLGQMVKAKLYRENYTEKHAHTHSQKEEKEKKIYISLLPKSTASI